MREGGRREREGEGQGETVTLLVPTNSGYQAGVGGKKGEGEGGMEEGGERR